MASPTFAKVSSGSLTGMTNLRVTNAIIRKVFVNKDTTHAGSGTAHEEEAGRFYYAIRGTAQYYTSNAYPRPGLAVSVTGAPIGRVSRVRLARRMFVHNVTAANDAEAVTEFATGVKTFYGSGSGFKQSTETPLSTQTIASASLGTLVVPLDTGVNLSAAARLSDIEEGQPYPQGGAIPVTFRFAMSSTVTITGATPWADESFSATLNTADGESWTGTILLPHMSADINYRDSAPVDVQFSGMFSGAVAIV